MKKKDYIILYKTKLEQGQKLYQHPTKKDAAGDPICNVWPDWVGKTALGDGWIQVATVEPIAEKVERKAQTNSSFEENLQNSMNVIEYEHSTTKEGMTASAQALAEEHGVNPALVEGTGRNGKITKFDILKYLNK